MHHFFSMMFSLPAIIGHVSGVSDRPYRSELKVTNGGPWGSWGEKQFCPSGSYAGGFQLKVENPLIFGGDDTALNGIRLFCVDQSRNLRSVIESSVGGWGDWTGRSDTTSRSDTSRYFTAFQLQVESPQGSGDDTAANNIKLKYGPRDWDYIERMSAYWGDYGDWSPTCEGTGICGLQTRVEESQGSEGDDTALNDVIMFCCD
ncbi:vitelline membrane outer layer protein 1-like [Rhinichthys klamathensis goyatoka]|uniref:vitelline membrane outer layer protein 1-like n=1 Tax=Rhinichthys klamathensis goyatoka TaxID=3034132 RepID=UPI0024B52AE0|nr:vitelline membrane outer layer protein 1-like [Rhinichthys klamathensis goyatoka]